VIHCSNCGIVPGPEEDLPVALPEVEKYEPGPDGESPLANITEWVNVKCPKCGGQAKRETDVMPNWAGSSWYFLAYIFNKEGFINPVSIENWNLQIENFKHFMPVDWYNGGMEHTVLHLLYSRFWNKFLYDLKLVPTSEPYKKRTSHGLILAEGGEKMSKSKGNTVNPDSIVAQFGADTLRLYEMFMGPFEQAIPWSEDSLVGPRRFLEKVWRLQNKISAELSNSRALPASGRLRRDENLESSASIMHQTIKKVSEDIESMKFNTAVSTLMIFVNSLDKREQISQTEFETLLTLLAPFAPHMTEELWSHLGHKDSIHTQTWPTFDPKYIEEDEVVMAVQIDGKVRTSFKVSKLISEKEVREAVLRLAEVEKWLQGKEPKKVIVVMGKIISIVT
jgi:leucyl-tRNA synthetase